MELPSERLPDEEPLTLVISLPRESPEVEFEDEPKRFEDDVVATPPPCVVDLNVPLAYELSMVVRTPLTVIAEISPFELRSIDSPPRAPSAAFGRDIGSYWNDADPSRVSRIVTTFWSGPIS